jgi:hypothetical protein
MKPAPSKKIQDIDSPSQIPLTPTPPPRRGEGGAKGAQPQGRPSNGTCPREVDLPAYWLNSLSPTEKRDWEQHFQECAICRSAQAELEQLFGRMKIEETPTVDLAPRVMAGIPASAWHRPDQRTVAAADGRGPRPPVAVAEPRSTPLLWHFLSVGSRPALKIAALWAIVVGIGTLGGTIVWMSRTDQSVVFSPLAQKTSPSKPLAAQEAGSRPALRRSLDWLQEAQEPDGRWDAQTWGAQPQFGIGVSALALLALIHKEPQVFQSPYADTVRSGISHLIGAMNAEGLMGPALSGATYNQGLATLALLEAQARENHPEWKAAGERAVQWLIRAQHPDGGWGYIAGDTPNSSATIWPLQALIRAEGEGFTETRPAVDRGLDWLAQSVTTSGELAYNAPQPAAGTPITLTAAGAVCFLLQRHDPTHPTARRLMAALRRLTPGGRMDDAAPNYYRQYFVGKAYELATDAETVQRLAAGDNRWLKCQVASGPQAGSWEAVDPWGVIGGRVYSTALASLALPNF